MTVAGGCPPDSLPMPKASVDKDRLSSADERDIGPSGQVSAVEPISSEAEVSQCFSYDQLGPSVFRTDRAHVRAPPVGGELIHELSRPAPVRRSH